MGPHRADFTIRIAGRPPAEALSRGQQKLLVIALVLAQAELYQRHVGDACILLIDDLPAELDADNRVRVMHTLAALECAIIRHRYRIGIAGYRCLAGCTGFSDFARRNKRCFLMVILMPDTRISPPKVI
jgi:hypothetical protein